MRKAFTLIELLVVIAILAVLAVVVVLTLNPAGLLQESRDSNRLSDMATLNSAIGDSLADNSSESLGSANTVYISVPDPVATSSAGDQCQGLGLPSLPASDTYQCASPAYYRQTNGTGWIPINLSGNSYGSSLSELPIDPINTTSTGLYYTYATNGSQFEVTSLFESSKYKLQYAQNPILTDYPGVYAKGSNLTLNPLWNSSGLVGWWPLNEGTGTTAYDQSGNNNNGAWSGNASGTSGYYSAGKVGSWAGSFDGSTTYLGTGSPAALMLTNALTVSAWINTSNPTKFFSPIFIDSSNNTNGYGLEMYSALGEINLNLGGSNAVQGSTILQPNTWYYVTGTWNGATASVYVNGILNGSVATTSSLTYTGASALIGKIQSPIYFPGLINDVRVYNRALSAAEIQALYNAEH